jgi:tetratricopeptide (TPR) repeat protein
MSLLFSQKTRKIKIKFCLLLWILLFSFCAPHPQEKLQIAPPPVNAEAKVIEAETLTKRACYVCFKQAFQIYEDLYAYPSLKKKLALQFLKTSLLLAFRTKEIGIINPTPLNTASTLILENPELSGFLPCVKIVGSVWPKTKGVMRDIDPAYVWMIDKEELEKIRQELKVKAASDEFMAYLHLATYCYYEYLAGEKEDISAYLKLYPDSRLVKYKNATCFEVNPELLQVILQQEPEFYEVYYHLGDFALQSGKLLQAEGNLLKAFEGIPESPQITILLASIYFATEELERSLEFYEKTLAITPDYREAMLGKAICLSYMGKSAEAIPILENLISLGYMLMGESYYWLAWNQHELGKNEEAAANIEQAKSRLPTDSEVFRLSGTMAFEKDDFDQAEKDFKEALEYNPSNSEALLGLGRLYVQKDKWMDSGIYYEKAGVVLERTAEVILQKIRELKESSLSEERKNKLILKKKSQLQNAQAVAATAFYNSAAQYYNAGLKEKALGTAEKAAFHPFLKQKAKELILKIKK